MTEQEKINLNLQRQIDAQTARIDNVLAKVDMLVIESQQQREDMRRAQEKHDADIKALNERIESKFDKLSSQIQNLTIAAVVGIGAIVIGGGAIIWSAISTLK